MEAGSGDSASAEVTAIGRGPAAGVARPQADPELLGGLEADRDVTDWGRSRRLTGIADRSVLRFLFDYWHRVEVDGVDRVPRSGGVLIVANRAGALPVDGAMIARAIAGRDRRDGGPWTAYLASAQTFAGVPGLGMLTTKLGGVSTHPADLHRLLHDEGQAVLLFPEGRRAVKPLRWRYRLRSFDAVDFARVAARARVPIVPVAVLGAEEALPTLATVKAPRTGLRLPLSTPIPLPAKVTIRFLDPVNADTLAPAADDRVRAAELGEEIRGLIQENVFELLAARTSVWLG